MSVIRPFKAVRPVKELAAAVAALPFDVMTTDEAIVMAKDNKHSFLHVDKAEIDLDRSIDLYDKRVYEKARDNLYKMIDEKVLVQDEKRCFYVYRLTMNGRAQTGLVICASIDEYIQGKIKKHEFTRKDKEQDRTNHVDYCNANTGPIFLTYKSKSGVKEIINAVKTGTPEYDFVADDGIGHTVWTVSDDALIAKLIQEFAAVPALYIADGHHRNASAVNVGQMRRKEASAVDTDAEYNSYLAVVFPDDELYIMDYNRVVKDLNNLSEADFLNKVKEKFDVAPQSSLVKPDKIHTFGMYLSGKWYLLTAKPEFVPNDPVNGLDVSVLQNELLAPVLAIGDPRTDKRIDFVGGIRGIEELERLVDSGAMKVAFSMYPTSMDELIAVADADCVMPPKSTWFEPKLRSGLFIHLLK